MSPAPAVVTHGIVHPVIGPLGWFASSSFGEQRRRPHSFIALVIHRGHTTKREREREKRKRGYCSRERSIYPHDCSPFVASDPSSIANKLSYTLYILPYLHSSQRNEHSSSNTNALGYDFAFRCFQGRKLFKRRKQQSRTLRSSFARLGRNGTRR